MAWLLTVLGVALAAVALRDIFHTVWYPRGYGFVAQTLCRVVWRLTRLWNRWLHGSTELGGPLGLLLTVTTWAVLIVLGFALIYLPHLPEGFFFTAPSGTGERSGFWTAVYVSLVNVATLGLGDIAPVSTVLRVIVPLQALVGFILLTSAISWVLQVYPTLSRRRGLALHLSLLNTPQTYQLAREGQPEISTQLLNTVMREIASCATDLSVYGESYFFRESEPTRSLSAQLPVALRLVQECRAAPAAEVRHAAQTVWSALEELAETLNGDFLHLEADTEEVLRAFAADHQQRLVPTHGTPGEPTGDSTHAPD